MRVNYSGLVWADFGSRERSCELSVITLKGRGIMRIVIIVSAIALVVLLVRVVRVVTLVMNWSGSGPDTAVGSCVLTSSCSSYFRICYFPIWFLLLFRLPRLPALAPHALLALLVALLALLVWWWCRANELERLTNVGVTGADGSAGETSAARELHAALRDVRDGLINAQKLWRGAEEAADKCQVGFAVVGRGGAAVVFCSVGCLVLFWGMVAFVRCFLLVLCCFRRMLGVGLGLCRWFVFCCCSVVLLCFGLVVWSFGGCFWFRCCWCLRVVRFLFFLSFCF